MKKMRLAPIGVTGLMLALAAPAFAEDRLDAIIVTSPGPERQADELIGGAVALDREDLIELGGSTLGDALATMPGTSTTFFGQGASRPVLRGLGAERVQVLTNGLGVIDVSAASPDHQVVADTLEAQSVEILRGPAALAYGGQAVGGVVNVIDGLIMEALPEETFSADLFGAFNSVNEGTELAGRVQGVAGPFVGTLMVTHRDFGDFDVPGFLESAQFHALEEDEDHHDDHDDVARFGVRDEDDHDDEEEARDTVENSFVKTTTISGGLSWVGENGYFGVAVRHQEAEYGLPGHSHHHEDEDDHDDDGPARFVALDEDDHDHEGEEEESPFIDLEQTRIDVRGGFGLGDGLIEGVDVAFSYADYTHSEFEGPGEVGARFDTEGYEGRVDLVTGFGEMEGVIGFQGLSTELEAAGEEAFLSPTDSNAVAVYLYQSREYEDGLGIEFGARAERIERDNVLFGETSFDLFSGSFGVHRHFGTGWFTGVQLAYTQRAPNESELFAFGPHLATEQFEVGDPTLSKEKAANIEGVFRWQGDKLSVGANVFFTDFQDFVYLAPGSAIIDGVLTDEEDELPVTLFLQQGASFVGAEFYGHYLIEDGPLGAEWDFDAGIDLVSADLDDGQNVPFIPPATFRLGASAEWGAYELGARVVHAAEQDDAGLGQLSTDSYTTLDLHGEVDLSDWGIGADGTEAFIQVRNVTDEEVRYATSVLKDLLPAPGRNVRVGVRAAF